MQVVVDTSVVGRADTSLDDMQVLYQVMEGPHELAVDEGNHVLGEYYRHIDFNGVAGEWFKVVSQRIVYFSGLLEPSQIADLDSAGGDDDDYPFIGVATRTDSGVLLHYDRGYDESVGIRETLTTLGVRPYRARRALSESVL